MSVGVEEEDVRYKMWVRILLEVGIEIFFCGVVVGF